MDDFDQQDDGGEVIEPIPLRPKAPESSPAAGADETQITIPAFKPRRSVETPAPEVTAETRISEIKLPPEPEETSIEEVYRKPSLDEELPKTRFDLPEAAPVPRPSRWPIYLSILLMLAFAGLWFAYLQERTENHPAIEAERGTPPGAATMQTSPEPIESPEEKRLREAALQVQAEYRFAKGEWDYREAARWSLAAYAAATNQAGKALGALEQKAYASSSNMYRQAVTTLDTLEEEQPAAVSNLIHQASAAFVEPDYERAAALLELALRLAPDDAYAKRFLKRAQAGPEVARLLARGAQHEQAERWPLAHADYQEATQLDPESGEAASAFNRIKERMVESGFQMLMSQGLSAFAQGDYTNALVHLIKAKAYRPDSSEAKDALLQVNDAIRLQRLERQREQAEAFEASEAWSKALAVYMEVLGKDPQVEFARQGRLRATQQIELADVLRDIIRQPDALLERKGQQHAHRVVSEVAELSFKGETLARLADEVQALLQAVRQPVEVTLTSDGMTRVSLYRVGQFGTMTTKIVDLTPGTYTVVGARAGYRDVRIDFVLKPGSGPRTVEVICQDKI